MMFPKPKRDTPAKAKWKAALKESKKGKRNKLNAQRTICSAGHNHPSKLEAAVCELLMIREKAGDIRNLKWQATVQLGFGVEWTVDWRFEQGPDWEPTWAEAKGKEQKDFKLKFRMWKEGRGPGPLEMWRGTHQKPYLERVYWPEKEGE